MDPWFRDGISRRIDSKSWNGGTVQSNNSHGLRLLGVRRPVVNWIAFNETIDSIDDTWNSEFFVRARNSEIFSVWRLETVFSPRNSFFLFFFPRSWKICIGITGSGLIVFRQSGGGNIDACSGMNLGIERSFLWNKCFHRNFQLRAVTPFPLIRSGFRGRNRIFFYSQQFYILFLSFTYVHVGPFFLLNFYQ